jgi:hypothetical protein
MASRTEIAVVYGAAVAQGLALVTFPAASSIFTSPDGFGFDSTRYGAMFVPQVAFAILASALAPKLARRVSLRRVLLAGFAGNAVSMTLLALSRLLMGTPDTAAVLLFAPPRRSASASWRDRDVRQHLPRRSSRMDRPRGSHPQRAAQAGNALARCWSLVVAIGAWWLLAPRRMRRGASLRHPLAQPCVPPADMAAGPAPAGWTSLPGGSPIRAVFVYGLPRRSTATGPCSTSRPSAACRRRRRVRARRLLGDGDVGRVFIALISGSCPRAGLCRASGAAALYISGCGRVQGKPAGSSRWARRLACSAFLPLSISFGGKEFPHLSAVMAGGLIAFYQLGYGVAAFGIGPLHAPLGLTFATIFAAGTLVALPLVAIAYFVVRGGPSSARS